MYMMLVPRRNGFGLFVIFVLFIGLYTTRINGAVYGVILGLLLDLFIGKNIGISEDFFSYR